MPRDNIGSVSRKEVKQVSREGTRTQRSESKSETRCKKQTVSSGEIEVVVVCESENETREMRPRGGKGWTEETEPRISKKTNNQGMIIGAYPLREKQ